ncbi:hypothetical protein GIB67_034946, partial [Kingdonia uniflora]
MNTTSMTVRILCLRKRLKPRTIENHTSLVLNIFGILRISIQNGIRRWSIETSMKSK